MKKKKSVRKPRRSRQRSTSEPPKLQALISVTDKTGVVQLARALVQWFAIVSTGGTYAAIKNGGVKCRQVARVTGFPECFDGRVKTIHPKILGGILARRIAKHEKQLKRFEIGRFRIVVVNLYDFMKKALDPNATQQEIVESIDIGGVLLLRAAAKAYAEGVIVVCDPADYSAVIDAIDEHGNIPDELRLHLAQKAFQLTATYDAAICQYLGKLCGLTMRSIFLEHVHTLRKAENDDQGTALVLATAASKSDPLAWRNWTYTSGNLGSVNLCGGDSTLSIMCRLAEAFRKYFDKVPHIVIACKHGNPCGLGVDWDDKGLAIERAMFGDPVAVMGAEIMANFTFTGEEAAFVNTVPKRAWATVGRKLWGPDVIFTAGYSQIAESLLTTRDPERHLMTNPALADPFMSPEPEMRRPIRGGEIIQGAPTFIFHPSATQEWIGDFGTVSRDDIATLLIAWVVAWEGVSNSITLAKDLMLIGAGLAQQDRRGATKLAFTRAEDAGHSVEGAWWASDGFLPFAKAVAGGLPETPEMFFKAGCRGGVVPADGRRWIEVREFLKESGMTVAILDKSHRGFRKH